MHDRTATSAVTAATLAMLSLLAGACDPGERVAGVSTDPPGSVKRGAALIYVPVYSHATTPSATRITLAITLVIHNVDLQQAATVRSVEYLNESGGVGRNCLASPLTLAPLEAASIQISGSEAEAGVGARLVVSYDAEPQAEPPLVEAVMVGTIGSGWLSLTSRGVPIRPPPPAEGGGADE